jgi:hypothetical protein
VAFGEFSGRGEGDYPGHDATGEARVICGFFWNPIG